MRARIALLGIALVSTLPCAAQEDLQSLRKMLEAQSLEIQELRKQVQALQAVIPPQQPTPPTAVASPEPASESANQPATTHVISKGETLTSIARKHKVNVTELLNANKITDDRKLQIGQTLVIPQQTTEPEKQSE